MAKKDQEVFRCPACGYRSAKWMGFCPACHEAPEGLIPDESAGGRVDRYVRDAGQSGTAPRSLSIQDVEIGQTSRTSTGLSEFDRVLGGGIVPASFILLGGDPGIGKSTLILQMVAHLSRDKTVLIVCGEESPEQIRMRFDRLDVKKNNPVRLFLLPETDLSLVLAEAARLSPDILIVDSIQTVFLPEWTQSAGSVIQLRETAATLLEFAKRSKVSTLVIGHVTKDGTIAGPRVLEHLVDTVLYLEGERGQPLRILRTAKNRFGPTQEVGLFEMEETGLSEVTNPSAFFLEGRERGRPGSVVVCGLEGSRPILVELQALAAQTSLPMPRRVSQGINANRLSLLTAVLIRRIGVDLSGMDLYLNVVGGVDLEETALDLGIAMAVASSVWERVLPSDWVVVGEVGLGGEIRRIPGLIERMSEAARLGFSHMIGPPLPPGKSRSSPKGLLYHPVTDLRAALNFLEKKAGKNGEIGA
ncbi:MAG: DNA repair protein RadA [Nitrospirota bacterium]|nr:DNA repair protein RadA [Nitrospirota bacterium]